MNMKALLTCTLLAITVVAPIEVNATVLQRTLEREAVGVIHPEVDVRNFWYTSRIDKHSVTEMLSKGIYRFQYVSLDNTKPAVMGITELGVEYPDELDADWTVIFYLAESTMYDRSVFAINNGDGTATVYEPGEAPF